MSALATVLAVQGWRLSASDGELRTAVVLPGTGLRVAPGHSPRYLPADTDVLIYSAAVGPDNNERRRAMRLGIPTVSYAQMLGHLMRQRTGLAVAGTHGKSTTTAMAAAMLIRAGLDPTVVIGAAPVGWHSGGRPGAGRHMLAEACEYLGNFLNLAPHAAVLLNLEMDHGDYFRSLEHLESTFADFVRRVSADGFVAIHSGSLRLQQVGKEAQGRIVTFGTEPTDQWRVVQIENRNGYYRFDVWKSKRRFASVRLSVPGRHQVLNALGAIALVGELGVAADVIQIALEEFRGVARRAEVIHTAAGPIIFDDYAHHPSAVAASLQTAGELFPGRRVWCIFEPHQASRLQLLLDDFARTLQNADRVLVTDIYRARESIYAGGASAAELVDRIRSQGGEAQYIARFEHLLSILEAEVLPADVIVTLGAGEVGKIRHALIERLRRNRAS